MSIRTDDLGFVFYEADEQEEKELEYVYAITDSWNYMGDEVIDTFPRRFWDRVCQVWFIFHRSVRRELRNHQKF